MESMELKLPATLEQAQLGAISAGHIARDCYKIITGAEAGKENTFIDAVELAVGEACTNSVKHCLENKTEDKCILVRFKLEDDKLVVMISDQNEPFEFDKALLPDFEQAPEGGYGIYIIKETMDEVTYERSEGWNILTLKKKINPLE